MMSLRLNATLAVAAVVAMTLTGCCKKEKEQIAALQGQYNDLSLQNKDLKDQLAQARTHEAELQAQLEAKALEAGRPAAATVAPRPAVTGNWDIGRNADRVTVGSDILFASGKASLTSEGKKALDRIVADIKSKYAGKTVRVYGYTDSDPISRTKNLWQDNLDLSANRAMAVTRYLNDKGINAENVETVAMGATHFVAANKAASDKAKNRRVEIVVIK